MFATQAMIDRVCYNADGWIGTNSSGAFNVIEDQRCIIPRSIVVSL